MPSVLIPLAEGFEELEAVAIIDVLRRGDVEVTVAGLKPGPHRGARGTVITPDATLDDVMGREFDMIVLPGGQPGVKNLHADPRVTTLLQRFQSLGRHTAAICAAPSILADLGMLAGKRATSHPSVMAAVKAGANRYLEDDVVTDGKVVTSRGAGTAVAFALQLVETLMGRERRRDVEEGLVLPAA